MFDIEYGQLMLAQDGAPPLTGNAPSGTTGTVGGDGSGGGTTAPPPTGLNSMFMLIMLALGAMILFSILGQRRERKKREALLSKIRKHDKVQTIGGIVGSVVEVKTNTVVLKVDESSNTRMTFARSAVQQVLSGGSSEEPAEAT